MPESDGAGAEADVVRGGGPAHSTGLSSTFSSPAARASVGFLPFQVVSDISLFVGIPGWYVQLCQRLRYSELVWRGLDVDVGDRVF